MKKAFSLIELSVVVLIIGLLVAGISSGAKLLKQAELRKIVADAESLKTAYNSFKTQYGSLPGDMPDASSFFTNCAATPANCNGNGDYRIAWQNNTNNEIYAAMLHLNRAGLIDNNVPAMPDAHAGENRDASLKGTLDGSGYLIVGQITGGSTITHTDPAASGSTPAFTSNISILMGRIDPTYDSHSRGVITAGDAYQIDKKIDDGSVSGTNVLGGTTGNFRASIGSDANFSDQCYEASGYVTTSEDHGCMPYWKVE